MRMFFHSWPLQSPISRMDNCSLQQRPTLHFHFPTIHVDKYYFDVPSVRWEDGRKSFSFLAPSFVTVSRIEM